MQIESCEFHEGSGIWHGYANTAGRRYRWGVKGEELLWYDRSEFMDGKELLFPQVLPEPKGRRRQISAAIRKAALAAIRRPEPRPAPARS
jgi:hypothetical protein